MYSVQNSEAALMLMRVLPVKPTQNSKLSLSHKIPQHQHVEAFPFEGSLLHTCAYA